jgi:RNA polymerase sigma-70 factor, ECF subfamily
VNETAQTRDSLLARVRDPADREAWQEFVAIYWPVAYRLARRSGMQDADAQDLAQQTLFSVSRAVERWERREGGVRFRAWLRTIARNALLNAVTRAPRDQGRGGSSAVDLLAGRAARDERLAESLELERRRELFRYAARQVETEVDADTWEIFRRTATQGQSCERAAHEMDKSIGAVYAARSRVMKRLRERAAELQGMTDLEFRDGEESR